MRTCSNVFFYFGCGDSDGGWCSVGFGIYDVHSTRVPSEEEMRDKLKVIVDVVKEKGSRSGEDLIFVNPVSERMQSNKNQADIDFFFFLQDCGKKRKLRLGILLRLLNGQDKRMDDNNEL